MGVVGRGGEGGEDEGERRKKLRRSIAACVCEEAGEEKVG